MNKEYLRSFDIPSIRQAADLIASDVSKTMTLEHLADKVGINPAKLKAGFKQLFQQSLYQYTLTQRLRKVIELLEETDLSLKQIAYKTGFDSRDSLSRCFRTKFKLSPRDYRKRQQLHPETNVSMLLSCTAVPNLN